MYVRTTGQELWLNGGDELSLERLRVGALGVLHSNVPVFDPAQEPQEVAVTKEVRCLKLPGDR